MRKDLDLGKGGEYCRHTRNTALEKAGVNRVKRKRVKAAIAANPEQDGAAAPKSKNGAKPKRWGVKCGKYTNWYTTEKARNSAYDAAIKAEKAFKLAFPRASNMRYHEYTKVQR